MPLTLTTLASLVPADLGAEIRLIDEGIEDVEPLLDTLDADLVGGGFGGRGRRFERAAATLRLLLAGRRRPPLTCSALVEPEI